MLFSIQDRRVRGIIAEKVDSLAQGADSQGKPLKGELAGFRSVRAVGQRWRIIYKVESAKDMVIVAAVGIRKDRDKKDAYALARKLLRLGLLGELD
ncbi:MAG: type II toxin-antitoxin system RelE/ParE family toxin [Nitrospinae bacterium]|nr:type II toxin-antitoxin system RelE/ParE family toxin [Nitrospinota bacterium]